MAACAPCCVHQGRVVVWDQAAAKEVGAATEPGRAHLKRRKNDDGHIQQVHYQ
jgi:hypothetical protein